MKTHKITYDYGVVEFIVLCFIIASFFNIEANMAKQTATLEKIYSEMSSKK